jgi:hypothetical protein
VVTVDKAEVSIDLDVPALPDWVNFNVNAAALVGIDLPSLNEESLVLAARHDPDPTWRLFAAWALLGELGKPVVKEETKPTISATDAVLDVLTKDPSPYVREGVLQRLAHTGFKKLPPEFSAPIYALAKRPDGLNEDPQGTVRVRRAAMEALGRIDDTDAHKWLMDELMKPKPDLAYLSGLAMGAARLSSNAGLASLRAAITTQKARSPAAYRRTVEALGAVTSADVLPVLKETLGATASEPALHLAIVERLKRNRAFASSPELAQVAKELALDESTSEGARLVVLSLLEGSAETGRKAAAAVAAATKSERVKARALALVERPPKTRPRRSNLLFCAIELQRKRTARLSLHPKGLTTDANDCCCDGTVVVCMRYDSNHHPNRLPATRIGCGRLALATGVGVCRAAQVANAGRVRSGFAAGHA